MRYLEFAKRIIPFVVTFVLGLFIASFFVALSAPKVEIETNWEKRDYGKMRMENRKLKKENCRLKWKLRKKSRESYMREPWLNVPPPPPSPAAAPKPPIAPSAKLAADKAREAVKEAGEQARDASR